MTSIPVAICRTSINMFKHHYLKNKKVFEDFLLHLWNLHEMENILKKKMSILASVFPKLLNLKEMVT